MLFRMVPKLIEGRGETNRVLECVVSNGPKTKQQACHATLEVLELCCFEWSQNPVRDYRTI